VFAQIASEETDQPCDVKIIPAMLSFMRIKFLVCRSQTATQLYPDLCCSHDAFNCLLADAGHCRFGSIDLDRNADFCTKLAHFC